MMIQLLTLTTTHKFPLQEHRERLEKRVVEEDANYEQAMTSLQAETQVFQDERDVHSRQLVGLRKAVDETQSVLTIGQEWKLMSCSHV